MQIGIALLIGSLAGCAFGSLAMLAPITLGLVQRQRTRRTLVRVGRSRSWVTRPGEGDYATAGPARGDPFDGDPDDRIIERMPRYTEQDDPGFGEPTPGDVGFGGQIVGEPFGRPALTYTPGFGGPTAGPPREGTESGTPEQNSEAELADWHSPG
jgi:hypothetical protein